ncbi:E3 ubiquitin-protein ligase NEURL3-like [Festucalex cinctus]
MHSCYKCTWLSLKQVNLFFKPPHPDNHTNRMVEREELDVESKMLQRCNFLWLEPLTFHPQTVGDMVHLSQGCRHVKRSKGTFRNGLVFSNRPVRVEERIRLWVESDSPNWHGAMRVGFTTVSPDSRSLPLPGLAIPDLTETPGHWATPVQEEFCKAGSELEFWVSSSGSLYVSNQSGYIHKLLRGVDVKRPLWAMIDVYGQTCSIILLGSEKRTGFFTRRSRHSLPSLVSVRDPLTSDDDDSCLNLVVTTDGDGTTCVVCMDREANVFLPCGHRCLCQACSIRVYDDYGFCPLCRQNIEEPPEDFEFADE